VTRDPVALEAGLTRELTRRQLTMIAIGGAIGTGLSVGSGISIALAGPAVVAAKLIPQNAFVALVGIAIFGGLYAWAQIFATHLFFLRRTSQQGERHARWRTWASAAGLAAMVAVIVTTWWVPGFRVTLLCGIPWLLFLTVIWRLSRSPS